MSTLAKGSDEDIELRRGPWTLEEDSLLIQYIACHGEGRWDMLAKCSGLRRTGKSCRLRWLNYLKPDVKRGNLTLEEQVLILELHSKWGNRWSRIAQHLPGRTDNEIKNYWRTRVQKHARQLKIDANSAKFHDVIRCFWMPRLLQKIEENSQPQSSTPPVLLNQGSQAPLLTPIQESLCASEPTRCFNHEEYNSCSENCNSPSISSSVPERSVGDTSGYLQGRDLDAFNLNPLSETGQCGNSVPNCQLAGNEWVSDGMSESLWTIDELWQFTKLEEGSI